MSWSDRSGGSGPNRRTVLRALGASGVAGISGLAGCGGDDGGDGTTAPGEDTPQDTGTVTGTPQSEGSFVVGSLAPLSGALGSLGEGMEQSVELAADYINEEFDGMNGREVEAIYEDTETDPETGRERARRLVEQENVDVLVGCGSGAVTNSVAEYAYEQRIPYWPYGGSEDTTGTNCRPTTFRYSFSTMQDALAGAPWTLENLGTNVWIHYADYSYGQSIREQWGTVIEESDMDTNIVEVTSTPIGTSDYSSYISQMQASDADWILMGVTGEDLIALVQQANQFGLNEEKDLVSQNVTTKPIRQGVGSDGVGVYGNIRYPVNDDREANQVYVDQYTDAFEDPPEEPGMVLWTSLLLHREAAEAAGSTDLEEITPELEGLQSDSPMGEVEIRECDHQAARPYPMGRITEPDEQDWPSYEVLDTRPTEDVIEPCEESGCDMPSI